jgi:predicted DNA binding CopG/RHH family protein
METTNLTVKLPKQFVRRIKIKAAKDGLTMQQLVQALLEMALGKAEK